MIVPVMTEMLDQAIALFAMAEGIDDAYLTRRVREETRGQLGLEWFHCEVAKHASRMNLRR